MSENTKVGAKLSARLNLGDYNHAELTLWVEDRVRDDLDEGKTTRALDRLVTMLDVKLGNWAEGLKDESGTE
jgi:hypothetical protein